MQSLQLKAEAKREEVARFIRARSDPEFAKMIRIRQLGPEHVENQSKLRKASQVVRDRIVELEEYLAALKDKLQQAKTGRTTLKAPSLDSVARASRNITARTSAVMLELDNLALEMDLMRPSDQDYPSREASRALSRSVSVISGFDEGGPLNDVGNLARTLPSATTLVTADEIARAERAKSESVSVFLNARDKPLLNTRAVPSSQCTERKVTKPLQGSDLQIAFAKGPVHLGKRAPLPAPVSSAQPSSTTAAPAVAPARGAGSDQYAMGDKASNVPVLSKPPVPSASAGSASAAASTTAPSRFGIPATPGASVAAAKPEQKPATPSTPLNFGGFGSQAPAPAKAASTPFAGFGSSSALPTTSTSAAASPAPASKPAAASTPLSFGGFGSPAAPSPKPAETPFAGFGKAPVATTTSATSASKAAPSSTPTSFGGGFNAPAAAPAKPASTPFSGFGFSPALLPTAHHHQHLLQSQSLHHRHRLQSQPQPLLL